MNNKFHVRHEEVSWGEQCPADISDLVKKWIMEFVCGCLPAVEEAGDLSECLVVFWGFFQLKK